VNAPVRPNPAAERPQRGAARQVRVRSLALDAVLDPLAVYAALSDGGTRQDTMLFEPPVGPAIVLAQAALRIECRGPTVTAQALTQGGRFLLAELTARFAHRLRQIESDRLILEFPAADGFDAAARISAASPFDVLRDLLELQPMPADERLGTLCLGVLAYDHVDLFESLPTAAEDPLGFPDYLFWLAETLVTFEPGAPPRLVRARFGAPDDEGLETSLVELAARCRTAPPLAEPDQPGEPDFESVDLDDPAYEAVVRKMKDHILDGDVYQIVPSRTFRAPCPDPLRAFAALRALDPRSYRFFLSMGEYRLFGASPETALRLFDDGVRKVEVRPIAGTRPRGRTTDEDSRLEAELLTDDKEQAEHLMLVDLARNDVARISEVGTREVGTLLTIQRSARVMHLVSSVTGTLRRGYDAFHAIHACLNMGTLTGTPKIRATQLLREAERTKRGPYGGAVGWINGEGCMDSAVVIRSAVVQGGTAFVRAGAGIVHDSDPAAEADETKRKASAMLSVLAGAAG
jgi:anthranilate synthase component 1